jgi:isocitrate lyase
LTGIFTTRKRQLRLPIIVLGAVMIVFVIIPRIVAYNCSASFNLKKKLDSANIAKFQPELGAMGCKFQFVILADFYALNSRMFNLARGAGQLP